MVIIAVPSTGKGGLNENISQRFGRCESFTFVTIENDQVQAVKAVPNNAMNAMGGAGIQSAQAVGNNGATIAIVGFLGPNAFQSLSALNLKLLQAPNEVMTVKQVIDLFLAGKLTPVGSSTVGSHFGMGGGGMGGGRGGGGGGGGGRRMQ